MGEKYSGNHLCKSICRILFCKRLVNETHCYKTFAENLLPGSWTAKPHLWNSEFYPYVEKKLLVLASFEESLIWFCIMISVYQVEEHNHRIFSSEVLQ